MSTSWFDLLRRGAAAVRTNRWLSATGGRWVLNAVKAKCYSVDYMLHQAERARRQLGFPPESEYTPVHPWRLGIIEDPLQYCTSFVAACRELKVAYRMVNIFRSDWIDAIRGCDCDAFLVWPGECIAEWKKLFDERLLIVTRDLKKPLYPPYDATWLYASKERQRDWLDLHGFPHPTTWVFHQEKEALGFVSSATLPLVAKLDIGACASGVWILKDRKEAERVVRNVFRRGLRDKKGDRRARQWRHILLQEFIPNAREWRMLRIGDTYAGHEKLKAGQFHSGSGKGGWFTPPRKALELLHEVTEVGQFRSLGMDVFETPDGRLLINEMQTVFWAIDTAQMYVDGVPGRYKRIGDGFIFEEGRFCRNACCNPRVEDLLWMLEETRRRMTRTTD